MDRDLALQAAAEADQTFLVPVQEFLIHPGLVIESFEMRKADQFDQIEVTGPVLDQKREMVGALSFGCPLTVKAASGGDIHLASKDGFDAVLQCGLVKLDGSEEVSMIRQCQSAHSTLSGQFENFLEADGSVQEAVLTVKVKMNEI
jgi:hypothetical protein